MRKMWASLAKPAAILSVVVLIGVAAGLALRLGGEQSRGVPSQWVMVEGRVPATLYMPGTPPPGVLHGLPDPKAPGDRPPVVVLAHGHSADQNGMSWLARRLVAAGYGVVTFDFPGHGRSSRPHLPGYDGFRPDLRAVTTWIRAQPHVDGTRIILVGHSMGAAAVLDYAIRDQGLLATVAMGGGLTTVEEGVRGRNALFLVAEGDADVVKAGAERTARAWSRHDGGAQQAEMAPQVREIAGTDHLTMLYAEETVRSIVGWATASGAPPAPVTSGEDLRPGLAVGYLICLVGLMVLLGLAGGRLVRKVDDGAGSWRGLLPVSLALLLPMPWLAWGDAGYLIGLEAGGSLVLLLAAAGGLLLLQQRLVPWSSPLPTPAEPAAGARSGARELLPATAVVLAGFVLLVLPLGALVHGLVPTPARAALAVLCALLVLPFFLAADRVLRRGPLVGAALRSVLARLVVLAVTLVGVFTQTLPGMLGLYAMVLVPFFLLLELTALGIHAVSRDYRLTAGVQAGAVGWLLALLSPVVW